MSSDQSRVTVGLDIGYDAARLVAYDHSEGRPRLIRVGEKRFANRYTPATLFDHSEDVSNAVKSVLADGCESSWPVVAGLRNRLATVLIPHVDNGMPQKTVESWLNWEAEQFTDDSIEEYVVDVGWTDHETETSRDAVVAAARRDVLDALNTITQAADIEPISLSVATVALINSFKTTHSLTEWESAAVAHFEPGAVDIIFIYDTKVNLTVMPLEIHSMSEGEAIQGFSSQFRHLLNVMPEEEAPDTVYISSERSDIPTLCESWGEELNRRIEMIDPFQGLDVDSALKSQIKILNTAAFMVASGLALQPDE